MLGRLGLMSFVIFNGYYSNFTLLELVYLEFRLNNNFIVEMHLK